MNKDVISPSKLALLRVDRNLKQSDLAAALQDYINDRGNLSASVISMWETGRRPIPLKYLGPLSQFFGVDQASLLDDNKESTISDLSRYQIPFKTLYKFDGKPVYIEFTRSQHISGWAIYNHDKKAAVMKDKVINLDSIEQSRKIKIYATEYMNSEQSKKRVDLAKMLRLDHIWICMMTSDAGVRGLYNGWYNHNETHTALINNVGLVLPYEGINIAYTAYTSSE